MRVIPCTLSPTPITYNEACIMSVCLSLCRSVCLSAFVTPPSIYPPPFYTHSLFYLPPYHPSLLLLPFPLYTSLSLSRTETHRHPHAHIHTHLHTSIRSTGCPLHPLAFRHFSISLSVSAADISWSLSSLSVTNYRSFLVVSLLFPKRGLRLTREAARKPNRVCMLS